jgi:hypothetical protein
MLDFSVNPPVTAASECAAGCPAVEKGDWRGNYHSPKPCLHMVDKHSTLKQRQIPCPRKNLKLKSKFFLLLIRFISMSIEHPQPPSPHHIGRACNQLLDMFCCTPWHMENTPQKKPSTSLNNGYYTYAPPLTIENYNIARIP